MRHRIRRSHAAALLAVSLLALGACSDDGDDASTGGTTTSSGSGSRTEDATTTTTKPAGAPRSTTSTTQATAGPTGDADVPEDACDLLPADDASDAAGVELRSGEPRGDELRRVCAFSADDNDGIAVTLGVEGGGLFDQKAETSGASVLGPGEEVADLGDRALFFYSEGVPEGFGAVLVAVGDLTIDISMVGLDDEDDMREALVGLAELAVGNL